MLVVFGSVTWLGSCLVYVRFVSRSVTFSVTEDLVASEGKLFFIDSDYVYPVVQVLHLLYFLYQAEHISIGLVPSLCEQQEGTESKHTETASSQHDEVTLAGYKQLLRMQAVATAK
jgi:hypothetical protein